MTSYLDPTQAAGRAFMLRAIAGPVVMLNLLRFRDVADYDGQPELSLVPTGLESVISSAAIVSVSAPGT